MKKINTKQAVFVMVMVWVLAMMAGWSRAESWPSKLWQDLKEHSEVNLGENLAYGVCFDFTFGNTLHGVKTSIFKYRKLHLEYGALTVIDENKPFTHSLGISLYLQPFLNQVFIPEKWTNIRNLYFGPVVGYDLKNWKGMVQLHHAFGGKK